MNYLLTIDLIPVAVNALTDDAIQTQIAGNLIGSNFPTDEDNSLIFRSKTMDEIQQLN